MRLLHSNRAAFDGSSSSTTCSCHCHDTNFSRYVRPSRQVPRSAAAPSLQFDPLHISRPSVCHATPSNEGVNGQISNLLVQGDFCIIESRDAVKDFAQLQLNDINDNISSRQNKIFLLMEEVRRLRIQQRLKVVPGSESEQVITAAEELARQKFLSALPFLPPLTEKTLNQYFYTYALFVACVIGFGGILAPILQLRLGLGGTSYLEFVTSMGLPRQLAEVDPIVASFCGGSVGVLSALLVVEVNNVKKQQQNRCHYCEGTGYLTCGNCVGNGKEDGGAMCVCCAGTGKVMCTGCLCTGKQLATEHDPRIDPGSLRP